MTETPASHKPGFRALVILGWSGLAGGIAVNLTTALISTLFNQYVMESNTNISQFAWQLVSTMNLLSMFALALGVLATAGYFVAVAITTPHPPADAAASKPSADKPSSEPAAE